MGVGVGIPLIVIQILHYVHSIDFTYKPLIIFSYLIFALVFALGYYIDAELTLMYNMWKFHRVEFKKHFWQMVRLFVATVFSMVWLLVVQIYIFYLMTCLNGMGGGDYAMFDMFSQYAAEGFCPKILTVMTYANKSPNGSSFCFAMYDCQMLIPVAVFLWLDEPHDCFRCLGKDPDRHYSHF